MDNLLLILFLTAAASFFSTLILYLRSSSPSSSRSRRRSFTSQSHSHGLGQLPLGTLGWPIVGESLEFISCALTDRPESFMDKRRCMYGKVFKSHIFGTPTIVSTDAEVSKFVLQSDAKAFVPFYPKSLTELMGKSSILLINGGLQRRIHGLIGSFFKSADLKAQITRDMEKYIHKSMENWMQDQPIYIQDESKNIAFQVLVKALINLDPGEQMEILKKQFQEFISGLMSLPINIPGSQLYRSLQAKKKMARLIQEIIQSKRDGGMSNMNVPKDKVGTLKSKREADSMERQKESNVQQKKGRRVILFPLPLQGHINPMLQLASILYSKGFSITIIHTNFNSPNPSNYPHFSFNSISESLWESEVSTENAISLLTVLNDKCVVPFQDCLAKLISNGDQEEPVTCLITDAIWHFAQTVADTLRLPRIVLRTSSISSFLAFSAFQILLEKGYLAEQDSQLEKPVTELPPLRVKDIPIIVTHDTRNFHQLISAVVSKTKACSGLIWNSFEDLEQTELTRLHKDFPIPMFPIGPFHKYCLASSSSLLSQDQSCISWLDKQAAKSVMYVSFGSIVVVNVTEFLEIAWGLANSRVPFLWVVRPGLVPGVEWLEPLPKGFLEMLDGRGHIVKWAPQQEVLAHPAVGGFWTHNGWNSTLESICEGVPMICQPCFGDQLVNARYVSHVWRVGLHLERKFERREIETAIRRVTVEAEGQEMRERIMHLKEKLELSLLEAGSSYQSLERLVDHILSF